MIGGKSKFVSMQVLAEIGFKSMQSRRERGPVESKGP